MKNTANRNIKLAMLVFLLGMASTTNAVIRYVPDQYSTIQAAINASNNDDTVLVADGIYTGEGNRDIDFGGRTITVKSENGPGNCIIDCLGGSADQHRGFVFKNGEGTDSILDGFTITHGYISSGGGVYCRNSSPSILNCIISMNRASTHGGGILCYRDCSPAITN
ncbi:MAG: hypothetical protein ACYTDW_03315, partial [Planctomycetota bacterium]